MSYIDTNVVPVHKDNIDVFPSTNGYDLYYSSRNEVALAVKKAQIDSLASPHYETSDIQQWFYDGKPHYRFTCTYVAVPSAARKRSNSDNGGGTGGCSCHVI